MPIHPAFYRMCAFIAAIEHNRTQIAALQHIIYEAERVLGLLMEVNAQLFQESAYN